MSRKPSGYDQSFARGFALALGLALAFFAISLFQTMATFLIRLYGSDVMLGAVLNVRLASKMSLEIATFGVVLLLLHVLFALAVHALSYCTVIAYPPAGKSRNGVVVIWFALLLAFVLLQNAAWFPTTHSGSYYHDYAVAGLGGLTAAGIVGGLSGLIAAIVVVIASYRLAAGSGIRLKASLASGCLVVALCAVEFAPKIARTAGARSVQPNVIILGIDSLRLEQVARFGGTGATPNLDEFLANADVFTDTTTPLARTFPAWISILTGRAPRNTGAVFNLMPRDAVRSSPTLGEMLSRHGYSTIYATDEVRFSNIDQSYGFDTVITPPIGAADFLIGRIADLPLSNVVANSPLGAVMLDYLHANRAVASLYRPDSFIARLEAEIRGDGPIFAAIHLTAAHWPYVHAESSADLSEQTAAGLESVYLHGLRTADRMFGNVVNLLRDKGLLDNAIVVVLSDHGEALMLAEDSLTSKDVDGRIMGLQAPPRVLNWGHGQSVLSPVQYQVLLGFARFGETASVVGNGRDLGVPASLEDIVPTVLGLLKLPAPEVDGISLVSALAAVSKDNPRAREDRIRFTETDIRVAPSATGSLEEDHAAEQALQLFAVDDSSGWLHLRETMIPTLMLFKERAALDATRVLAALPVAPGRHEYLLIDRRSGKGEVLVGRPTKTDARANRLWDALHGHFGDELHDPIVVGPSDQAIFDAMWSETAPAVEYSPQALAATTRSPAS